MTSEELHEYLKDGRDLKRLANFLAGDEAVRMWVRAHPLSLPDYLDFLESVHDLFGPFPTSHEPWAERDFRL